jgi:hypothetical protein
MGGVTEPNDPSTPDEPPRALPLSLDLPASAPEVVPAIVGVPDRAKKAPAPLRGIALRVGLTLGALGLAAAGLGLYLLPRWVKDQVVQAAGDHGVQLTVAGASFDGSAFRLTGLQATAPDLTGAKAEAPELLVETQDLRPSRMTVRGMVLTLDGPWSHVDALIAKWRSSAHGGSCSDCMPAEMVVEGSRVVWTHPLADNGGVEANDVHLSSTFHANGAELHLSSSKVKLSVPGGTLGPWRVDVDRTPGASRVRVALDPGVPDASTILVTGDDERTTHVDLSLPRSPPARIGLPPGLLGLTGKNLQIEAQVHYADVGGGHAEAQASGGIHGIEAGGLPRALDVTWEASTSGEPRKGMDVKKARLAAGPLVGPVTGTLTTFDDGFRVDLAWEAPAVPCNAFDAPLDGAQPFDIAYQLRMLAQATGITKVTGDVSARGTAAFDSRDLGATRVSFAPAVSCQVALFSK